MCGIAGIFNLDGSPVSSIRLRQMTDAIKHRGPDGEGCFTDNNITLGHRRLAIIDLTEAGHQPMLTDEERFVITYNGELYNYKELRIELKTLGYMFHSKTDSEVVLKSLAEWGQEALLRFNGMFAFALWDRKERTLLLARDRYGIKPLYYTMLGSQLIFGSEIKAILASGLYKTDINKEALYEYFTFQNFLGTNTLFKDIYLLPAGSFFRISQNQKQSETPTRYWDFAFTEPSSSIKHEEEYIEELERLMTQAVNRQLVSDVAVGSYLSGGMDSGTVTALSAHQIPHIKSFTCGFDLNSASGDELHYDEREPAEYMSYLFNTEHYEMVLKSSDMERSLPKLVWHLEEPRVGQSYPNLFAAKLASKFVKVVMCGTGGDEIFAGYPWRYYGAVSNDNFEDYAASYYKFWQRLVPSNSVKNFFSPIWNSVSSVDTQQIFKNVFSNANLDINKPQDNINLSLYFEAKTFLQGLLIVEDKLSMANSLESRVPFLDNDLVDFAMSLPVHMKLGQLANITRLKRTQSELRSCHFNRDSIDGKLILRKAMKRYLPDKIIYRKKQGFSAPDASWFKKESLKYVKEKLYNNNAKIYNYLDKKEVHQLVDEHLNGRENRRLLVWSLLNIEKWLDIFYA